jgi:hypothetical protein
MKSADQIKCMMCRYAELGQASHCGNCDCCRPPDPK